MQRQGGGLRTRCTHAKNGRVVPFEDLVRGDKRQALDSGLGHEDAVERVPVMVRERRDRQGMDRRDGESSHLVQAHTLRHVLSGRFRERQPSDCVLDGDLPCAGGRQELR